MLTLAKFFIVSIVFFIFSRIFFSKKYRLYYFSTIFISTRLWISFFACMYLSTKEVLMWEIGKFSAPNFQIIVSVLFLSILLLFIESFASSILFKKMRLPFLPNFANVYIKYGIAFAVLYFVFTLYMYGEVFVLGGVKVSTDISKFNYVNFLKFPVVYKIVYALAPLLILVLAYNIVANKFFFKKKFHSLVLYFLFLICMLLHANVYALTHTKSHFVITYLMFFIIPIYYFCSRLKVSFFKNKIKLMSFFALFIGIFIFILYQNFGAFLIEAFIRRLTLEGQILYVSLKDFYHIGTSNSFLHDLVSPMSFIEILMYKYLPAIKISLHENTGWLMSGAMPGGMFSYSDFFVGLFFWVLNFFILSFFLRKGLFNFANGSIVIAFINLKLSWFVASFIAQGTNYLLSIRFLGLIAILIFHKLARIKKKRPRTSPCAIRPNSCRPTASFRCPG